MSVTINGTNGLTFNDASTQTTAATGFGFKNRIINGAMMIDQRNAGASVTPTTGGPDKYCVDRFAGFIGSGTGVFTLQQSSTAPTGFTNSLKVTVTTADSSLASTDNYQPVFQYIEGYNVADLGWGAAGASTVTVSFWARASVTGTYPVSFRNSAVTRSYITTITINVADTWEYKSVTVAGDTNGTWEKTTSSGISLNIASVGGSDKQIASLNTWTAGNYTSHSSCTNWIATNGATFYITGVQLEKGSTATSFDYRPYGVEDMLCKRYYWGINGSQLGGASETQVGMFTFQGTNTAYVLIPNPVQMRTSANITVSGNFQWTQNGSQTSVTNITGVLSNPYNNMLGINVISGIGVGSTGRLSIAGSANGVVQFSSEL